MFRNISRHPERDLQKKPGRSPKQIQLITMLVPALHFQHCLLSLCSAFLPPPDAPAAAFTVVKQKSFNHSHDRVIGKARGLPLVACPRTHFHLATLGHLQGQNCQQLAPLRVRRQKENQRLHCILGNPLAEHRAWKPLCDKPQPFVAAVWLPRRPRSIAMILST